MNTYHRESWRGVQRGLKPVATALALSVLCSACAPVDHTSTKDTEPKAGQPEIVGEKIGVAPKPLPPGPRSRIEAAVQNVRDRDLLTTNGFWTVFHGILGLGPSVQLVDPNTHKKVNAVEFICNGGRLDGLDFFPTEWGLDVRTNGPGGGRGQGHQDYFIAEMAVWNIEPTRRFRVFGKQYMFADFISHSKMRASVTMNQELSWTIVVLGQYLGTDLEWTNEFGEKLRFEDLVRYELDAPIGKEQAACGGTHRLSGLNFVYRLHKKKGGMTEGIWKEIVEKTAKYRDLAKKYQNEDGSFSTDFFDGPANVEDKQRRIYCTGHTLEWLAQALPVSELKEEWMQNAASALSLMILELQGQPIEGGSLYHAVHGLLIYYARVYDRETLGPPELHIP
jgi:hypothetical protein